MLNSFVLSCNFCACKCDPRRGGWGTVTWQPSPRGWWGTVFLGVGKDKGGEGINLGLLCSLYKGLGGTECHFVLLNSHIPAYATCFAGKVCSPVQSTWRTSRGEDKLGARARILNTKVA